MVCCLQAQFFLKIFLKNAHFCAKQSNEFDGLLQMALGALTLR